MTEVIGRAGFHAQHAKSVSERVAVLHEMMRELDEASIQYWAKRNPNIVVSDEYLNEAMVNDGAGGFVRCSDRQQVLDYGAKRVGKVGRKFTEDRPDPQTGKMKGGTVTTTLIVAHLPKSMCVESVGFYPILDKKTGQPVVDSDGNPMTRSRWVARDRDEARKYFEDVLEYLGRDVIPGGADGILGYDIQHSESTPHVQILADTFAPDPKKDDALRVETSRAWFSHRSVLDEHGKQKSGKAKMRDYHAGLKQHLIDLGYDISPDFDEERHLVGMGKEEYTSTQDKMRVVEDAAKRVIKQRRTFDARVEVAKEFLETKKAGLDEREGILDRREAELPKLRRKAIEEGKAEGQNAASQTIKQEVDSRLTDLLIPAQARLQRQRDELEEEMAKASHARQQYVAASAKFDHLIKILEPTVEEWKQANPHTERGRKIAKQLSVYEQIMQRAAEIRANAELDEAEGPDGPSF